MPGLSIQQRPDIEQCRCIHLLKEHYDNSKQQCYLANSNIQHHARCIKG